MGSKVVWAAAVVAALVAALAVAVNGSSRPNATVQTPPTRPLTTAVLPAEQRELDFRRVKQAGARMVRVAATWVVIAPHGDRKPAGFDAADPTSPGYDWEALDRAIRNAKAQGLEVILNPNRAPLWAQQEGPRPQGGDLRPSAREYAAFARAAATRYSGRFAGLPRVRYWQAWNEPNLSLFLNPQFVGRAAVSPVVYRSLLNEFARAVKAVRRDNLVVAGGLAPISKFSQRSVSPLAFMRGLLCVDRRGRPTCRQRAQFDIWAHHPYTTGGPTHEAFNRDDVALGDLPEMRSVLMAAYRAKKVQAPRRPLFWVTEFSWDTKPPDPRGVPLALHARWTSEALYRMWSAGVSLVTWWLIEDLPRASSPFQSGLFYDGMRAKPTLQAFRFPFVALRQRGGRVLVWGRTPGSDRRRVAIQQRVGTRWRRTVLVTANRHGIFTTTVQASGRGPLRAVAAGVPGATGTSRPFSLVVPPDRFVRPFG